MKPGTKIKWLLLLIVWGGCFLFCFFNADTVNSILDGREKEEILQKDMTFWKQNADKISGVIERQRLLRHDIDSLQMGIVFLDDTFSRLAADFNLTELKVDMNSRQAEGDSMPFKTSFKGTLKNGLDAIKKIQTEYHFIPFRSVKIEEENTGKSARFNILLDYKYHLKDI
jgi:hypothetical protein